MNLNAYVTGAQAARIAGVSKQLVNYWRSKGHLEQHGGRYRLGDVLTIEQRMRANAHSSRA